MAVKPMGQWRARLELQRKFLAQFRDLNPAGVDKAIADMDPHKISDEEYEEAERALATEYRYRLLKP